MKPDLTIVLDCPVETGLDRTRRRARGDVRRPDRFEGEEVEFHRKVRAGFLAIAKGEPRRVTVVDSARELDAVSADIRHAVDDLIARADKRVH
jgi:dTMP kinase